MHLSEIWHSKKNDCRLSRTQVNISPIELIVNNCNWSARFLSHITTCKRNDAEHRHQKNPNPFHCLLYIYVLSSFSWNLYVLSSIDSSHQFIWCIRMLTRIAVLLLRTVESIATPCSVKAYERTVECFKLLNGRNLRPVLLYLDVLYYLPYFYLYFWDHKLWP